MKEKPKSPIETFIGRHQIITVIYNGLLMAIAHYFLFLYVLKNYPYEIALTVSFTSAVISQWAVGIQEISDRPFLRNPIEHIRLNPYVFLGISIGAILQAVAIYLLSDYFHAVKLPLDMLPYVFFIPILTFLGIEVRKWVQRFEKNQFLS